MPTRKIGHVDMSYKITGSTHFRQFETFLKVCCAEEFKLMQRNTIFNRIRI